MEIKFDGVVAGVVANDIGEMIIGITDNYESQIKKLEKELQALRKRENAIAEHCLALCARGIEDVKRSKGIADIYRYLRQNEELIQDKD